MKQPDFIENSGSTERRYGLIIHNYQSSNCRLCGIVVRVSGYGSRGLGSIPAITRFSEK
jgi:hypothetical protein